MKLSAAEIDKARRVLDLGEKASLKEIKTAYRSLSKKWHPDRCREEDQKLCHEKMKEINRAYETIMKYVENYSYSFAGDKVSEEDPGAFWKKRFGGDPSWGGGWE